MCTIFDACYIRSDKTGVDPRACFRLVCTIHIGQFRGRLMRSTEMIRRIEDDGGFLVEVRGSHRQYKH